MNAKTQQLQPIPSIYAVMQAVWREVQYFFCVFWQLEVVQHISLSNLRRKNTTTYDTDYYWKIPLYSYLPTATI